MIITFAISFLLSYISESALSGVNIVVAFVLLLLFIFLGILFDIIGTSVTAADDKPFNSMAARKVPGARASLFLISKAATVSNICNDVVGDICGIISGTMTAVIASDLNAGSSVGSLLLTILLTAATASFTVGGKAVGKNIALKYSGKILHAVGRVFCFFVSEKYFGKK